MGFLSLLSLVVRFREKRRFLCRGSLVLYLSSFDGREGARVAQIGSFTVCPHVSLRSIQTHSRHGGRANPNIFEESFSHAYGNVCHWRSEKHVVVSPTTVDTCSLSDVNVWIIYLASNNIVG